MSVAKTIELISSSPLSFDDALKQGIARAHETLEGLVGAWVNEQTVKIEGGKVTEYRVNMRLTFVLDESKDKD